MVRSVLGFMIGIWGALSFYGAFTTSTPGLDEAPIYRALHPPYNFQVLGFVVLSEMMAVVGVYLFLTGVLAKKKWFHER